jgi:hypothetical protein
LGVLLTSLHHGKGVEYLEVDNKNFITRVKINLPSRDKKE